MKLLIARHAQTKDNENNVIQHGKSELSEKGLKQISTLIKRLEKEKIDIIISSDYDRCKITSEKIAENFNLPVEYNKLLREKNDGDWVGKSGKEVDWDSLDGEFETRRAPNGENLLEVRARGIKFYEEIFSKYGQTQEIILIASHSTILRLLIGHLIGLNIKDSIFNFAIDNCSLTEIDVNPKYKKGYQLKYLNEKSFLI